MSGYLSVSVLSGYLAITKSISINCECDSYDKNSRRTSSDFTQLKQFKAKLFIKRAREIEIKKKRYMQKNEKEGTF